MVVVEEKACFCWTMMIRMDCAALEKSFSAVAESLDVSELAMHFLGVRALSGFFDQYSVRFIDNGNGHTTGEAVAFTAIVSRDNGKSSPGPS